MEWNVKLTECNVAFQIFSSTLVFTNFTTVSRGVVFFIFILWGWTIKHCLYSTLFYLQNGYLVNLLKSKFWCLSSVLERNLRHYLLKYCFCTTFSPILWLQLHVQQTFQHVPFVSYTLSCSFYPFALPGYFLLTYFQFTDPLFCCVQSPVTPSLSS